MTGHDVVIVRRVIPVARERVFHAWLDPERLVQFMRPGETTRATATVDARVGGRFRIVMDHGGGSTEHTGEYTIIDPPARLQFTWISRNTEMRSTLVTIDFNEVEQGTEVVLRHADLPESGIDAHRRGWSAIMEKLASAVFADRASPDDRIERD